MPEMNSQLDGLVAPHNVVFETPRLCLRPVRPSDLEALHAMRRDPAVMEYMSTGVDPEPAADKSPESIGRLAMMLRPGSFALAVALKEPTGSAAIGFLGIIKPPALFYIYSRATWGQGYATEALRGFLAAYWETFPQGLPGLAPEFRDKLVAHAIATNAASVRVLERTGFTKVSEGVANVGEKLNVPDKGFEIYRPT